MKHVACAMAATGSEHWGLRNLFPAQAANVKYVAVARTAAGSEHWDSAFYTFPLLCLETVDVKHVACATTSTSSRH